MVRTLWDTNLIRIGHNYTNTGDMMSDRMKTIEEMHRLTIDEIRAYCTKLMNEWSVANKIRDYRIAVGDENNPYLLEAKNVEIIEPCADCGEEQCICTKVLNIEYGDDEE